MAVFDKAAEGRRQYNPQKLYQYIQRHPVITDWFNRKGYRTSIMPFANDLEERYAFHPLVIQRLLMGRLGEEAIRALLYSEGIITSSKVSNHRLFEQYDFSIKILIIVWMLSFGDKILSIRQMKNINNGWCLAQIKSIPLWV